MAAGACSTLFQGHFLNSEIALQPVVMLHFNNFCDLEMRLAPTANDSTNLR
jgi:hypothetical protein